MRYFIDCEFNGFGGELISIAIVRQDGAHKSFIFDIEAPVEPWVKDNVMPHLRAGELTVDEPVTLKEAGREIAAFLRIDSAAEIYADWPDDIRYLCSILISGPGTMYNAGNLTFHMVKVDAYPTTVEGAVQHNAYWDALALRAILLGL